MALLYGCRLFSMADGSMAEGSLWLIVLFYG